MALESHRPGFDLTWFGVQYPGFSQVIYLPQLIGVKSELKCCWYVDALQFIKIFLLLFYHYVRSFGCTQRKKYVRGGASE